MTYYYKLVKKQEKLNTFKKYYIMKQLKTEK